MQEQMERPSSKWMNKVPEVTLIFWIVKMMSTTVGETAADYLNGTLGFGLTGTSGIMGALLLIALGAQLSVPRYQPVRYWMVVVFVSIFGTLITDNLSDNLGVPLAVSTGAFSFALIATFIVWYAEEGTLSIHAIDTRRRELFYWAAILFTFALGTAAGDWLAEGLGLGFGYSAILFASLIALTSIAYFRFHANSVVCFWIAYVLTRPLGASCGDFLSQPADNGGLGLGVTGTNLVFLLTIIALVAYMAATQKRLERS